MAKRKGGAIPVEFGKRLAEYRKSCGYTQQMVADVLKIDRSTYTKYELGDSEPSFYILKRLCSIFGVDVNALLEDDPLSVGLSDSKDSFNDSGIPVISLSREEQNLIARFRTFTKEERDDILDNIDAMSAEKRKKLL